MLRTRIVPAAALALVLMLAPSDGRGEPQEAKKDEKPKDEKVKKEPAESLEAKQNEKLKGEIKGKKVKKGFYENGFTTERDYYKTEVLLTLEAGQGLSVDVTVLGDERKLAVILYDPAGDELLTKDLKVKAITIERKELPVSGKYKIEIYSPHSGAFTLLAKDPSKEPDEKTLQERIKELKKELADLEAKLEALKKKEK